MPKAISPIQIITIDNDFAETSLIKTWLEKDMRAPWQMTHCSSVEDALSLIDNADLVILKPEMNGQVCPKEVFKDIGDMFFEVPIIVLTSVGDERALSTYVMEQGAADTLIRGHFARLVDAVEFALIRQKIVTDTRRTTDKNLLASEDKGKADLKASKDDDVNTVERHRQIIRMLSGDYSIDN